MRFPVPIGGIGLDTGLKPAISYLRPPRRDVPKGLTEFMCGGRICEQEISVTLDSIIICPIYPGTNQDPFTLSLVNGMTGTFNIKPAFAGNSGCSWDTNVGRVRFNGDPTTDRSMGLGINCSEFGFGVLIEIVFPGSNSPFQAFRGLFDATGVAENELTDCGDIGDVPGGNVAVFTGGTVTMTT